MTASGIKLADANVWLAYAADGHQHHARARAWFDDQKDESCAFCRVTQMALLRHLTNSKIMGENVLTQKKAWAAYEELRNDPRVIFAIEPPGLESTFRAFTQSKSSSHLLWTDAYLAAFASVAEFQFVTFDAGIRRFSSVDIAWLDSK